MRSHLLRAVRSVGRIELPGHSSLPYGGTGFVVGDVDAMVDAAGRIGEIDPAQCRRHVEANFDIPVMVDGYVRLYEEILGAASNAAGQIAPAFAVDAVVAEAAIA